jgi:hypothetical protein
MITSRSNQSEADASIWTSLKLAISESSGFQRWVQDRKLEAPSSDIDALVRRYLRETLETLAY